MAQNDTITPHFKNNSHHTSTVVHSLSIKKRGGSFCFAKFTLSLNRAFLLIFQPSKRTASIEQHDAATQRTNIQKT